MVDARSEAVKANDAKHGIYSTGQTWNALRKCWKAYRLAKVKNNREDMKKYAERIRALQDELGVTKASFPDLGLA